MPAPITNKVMAYSGTNSGASSPILRTIVPTSDIIKITVPTYKPTSTTTNNESTIANILSSTASQIGNFQQGYIDAMAGAANAANAASAQAQAAQYKYNLDLMNKQNAQQQNFMNQSMAYNASSAAEANRVTAEMYKQAMEYNAKEAQTNREWQEKMSNTAYQRAVADMKAAGINPILAAQNGGASVGSGATANIGGATGTSAAGVNANAAGGSVGNYTGQGYNLSDNMAMLGSVVGLIGQLANSGLFQSKASQFEKTVIQLAQDAGEAIQENTKAWWESEKFRWKHPILAAKILYDYYFK